jgi:hypothetical protein
MRSYKSQTFNNEPLASSQDFTLANVEAWSLLDSDF